MLFEDIVDRVAEQLNLTSDEAIERVGRSVNERYKELMSELGIATTSVRDDLQTETEEDNPYVTFGDLTGHGVQKILGVYPSWRTRPLDELSVDQIKNMSPQSWPPSFYAVHTVEDHLVKLLLSATPTEDGIVITADGLVDTSEMTDGDTPKLPNNFHDVLVKGGIAVELDKMEKFDRAEEWEDRYTARKDMLKYYLAVSAYKVINSPASNQGRRIGPGSLRIVVAE